MGKYYTDEQMRDLVEQYKPVGEPNRPTEGMRTFLHGYAHAVEELTGLTVNNGKLLGEDGNVYLWLHPKSLEISDALCDDMDEKIAAIKVENAKLRDEIKRRDELEAKLIRCIENDYGILFAWDPLRKVWLSACTDEYVTERERLDAENAKLRKLVSSVLVLRHDSTYKWLDTRLAEICGKGLTEQAMDLGIEVDG